MGSPLILGDLDPNPGQPALRRAVLTPHSTAKSQISVDALESWQTDDAWWWFYYIGERRRSYSIPLWQAIVFPWGLANMAGNSDLPGKELEFLRVAREQFDSDTGPWDMKDVINDAMNLHCDTGAEESCWLSTGTGWEVYYDVPGNIVYGYLMALADEDPLVALTAPTIGSRATGENDYGDQYLAQTGMELYQIDPDGSLDQDYLIWVLLRPESLLILEEWGKARRAG